MQYSSLFFSEIEQTLEGSFSSVSKPIFATKASFFSIFRDLQDLQSFAPLESKWKKPWKNHPVDTIEKAENAESSEKITNKRYENYITPNNRLTRFVQQRAANTRLYKKLRLVQRRQSEQHRFANFTLFKKNWRKSAQNVQGVPRTDEIRRQRLKAKEVPEMS